MNRISAITCCVALLGCTTWKSTVTIHRNEARNYRLVLGNHDDAVSCWHACVAKTGNELAACVTRCPGSTQIAGVCDPADHPPQAVCVAVASDLTTERDGRCADQPDRQNACQEREESSSGWGLVFLAVATIVVVGLFVGTSLPKQ